MTNCQKRLIYRFWYGHKRIDLPFLPDSVGAFGSNLSPEILIKSRRLKLPACRTAVELIQGDAQTLLVA